MQVFEDKKYHITSFKRFIEIVEKQHSVRATPADVTEIKNKWIFRGHVDSTYKLIPSVGRLLGSERFPSKNHIFESEQTAFLQFQLQTYVNLRETNKSNLLAVAQQHGMSTRLLD